MLRCRNIRREQEAAERKALQVKAKAKAMAIALQTIGKFIIKKKVGENDQIFGRCEPSKLHSCSHAKLTDCPCLLQLPTLHLRFADCWKSTEHVLSFVVVLSPGIDCLLGCMLAL